MYIPLLLVDCPIISINRGYSFNYCKAAPRRLFIVNWIILYTCAVPNYMRIFIDVFVIIYIGRD